ncbi:flagellar motor protein MotB [Nitrosococcus oceani]|uniref:OmpA/MotB n=2 Tax=Nitrosococcus oceani TaxID=1229 RepID=Q3JCU9_NITOC|nr:flagellar motor protein MotB [Nitrosococcus oceani]KFI20323.1 flagellar motor protein MotB [Nitrosococcus oceani C-27]ABA57347.1 OmpA/MotB [Nitrosococcus oceani ATCC 19707]EDZ66922.1 OmpA family protein [Nitrosococcus oceani AFC27]KFI23425.1 flagellar motor protein MotB [Nitrosococcus oceani]GEM20222.1 flagellar motor protein MotB [Nitrosococcus oceani]
MEQDWVAAEDESQEERTGAPAWVITLADLMSLLMSFFVLLLSFSEMDVLKYKQVAGSMKFAFGVQREIKVKEPPKGTSIIAQEFSPGRPRPTPWNEIRQDTIDETKQTLDFSDAPTQDTEAEVAELQDKLQHEIDEGLITIETIKDRIIIRIREKGSFPSGSAIFSQEFKPALDKIRAILKKIEGKLIVAGHTDNMPIQTTRFRSNWELSTARAVSVVHYLLATHEISPRRFVLEGYADTQPLAPNENAANRARNRRIEITVLPGEGQDGEWRSIRDFDG